MYLLAEYRTLRLTKTFEKLNKFFDEICTLKGEGDLTLDETRSSILTTFFELEAPNLVRSVPVGGYLIY